VDHTCRRAGSATAVAVSWPESHNAAWTAESWRPISWYSRVPSKGSMIHTRLADSRSAEGTSSSDSTASSGRAARSSSMIKRLPATSTVGRDADARDRCANTNSAPLTAIRTAQASSLSGDMLPTHPPTTRIRETLTRATLYRCRTPQGTVKSGQVDRLPRPAALGQLRSLLRCHPSSRYRWHDAAGRRSSFATVSVLLACSTATAKGRPRGVGIVELRQIGPSESGDRIPTRHNDPGRRPRRTRVQLGASPCLRPGAATVRRNRDASEPSAARPRIDDILHAPFRRREIDYRRQPAYEPARKGKPGSPARHAVGRRSHAQVQELGFCRVGRDRNVLRAGWVAAEITKHGGIAVY
jgi:hypothetical protein